MKSLAAPRWRVLRAATHDGDNWLKGDEMATNAAPELPVLSPSPSPSSSEPAPLASVAPASGPLVGLVPEVMVALDGLMGERVFPVVAGDGAAQPTLIALDASGMPVAVEVVEFLDQSALLRALDHAGAAGRMSRGQLAASYSGGLAAFGRDLQQYLDGVPFRRVNPGNRGARLLIVCSGAQPEVLNAIDFLNRPELPIKVLLTKALEARDGIKFIDAAPLVVNPQSAPGQPELLGAPSASRLRIPAVSAPAALVESLDVAVSPVPSVPSVPPVVSVPLAAQQPTVDAGASASVASSASSEPVVSARSDAPTGDAAPTGGIAPEASATQQYGSRRSRRLASNSSTAASLSPSQAGSSKDISGASPLDDAIGSRAASAPSAPPLHGDDAYEQFYGAASGIGGANPASPSAVGSAPQPLAAPAPNSRRARRLAAQVAASDQSVLPPAALGGNTSVPVELPPSAPTKISDDAAPMTLTEQAIARAKAALLAPKGGLSRRSIRSRAASTDAEPEPPIDFAGVFAKGTEPTDHLSWDTSTLPVIARPITTSIPLSEIAAQSSAAE